MSLLARRTREHVIADLGVNYIQRFFFRAGYTAAKVEFDYGYDAYVNTFNEKGEVEGGICYLQIKATDHLALISGGTECTIVIERRHLETWLEERSEVFLMLYDAQNEVAYWLDIQESLAGRVFDSAKVTIRIPVAQRLDDAAIRHIHKRKRERIQKERIPL